MRMLSISLTLSLMKSKSSFADPKLDHCFVVHYKATLQFQHYLKDLLLTVNTSV